MKKKAYIKPAVQSVRISMHAQLLISSPAVEEVNGNGNLYYETDGFDDDEDDMDM